MFIISEIIELEMNDWLYNSGLVGLYNILNFNNVNSLKIHNDNSGFSFDMKELNDFEDMYFDYFINKYEHILPFKKIENISNYLLNYEENFLNHKSNYIEELNKYIEELKKKLTSNSYSNTYHLLTNIKINLLQKAKQLSKIKFKKSDNEEQKLELIKNTLDLILEINGTLKEKQVKKYLITKDVIYNIINNFWNNVSFLHKLNNKKDHFKQYKIDFIDSVKSYLTLDNNKSKYNCSVCDREITKLSKPESFDLVWINKIGVDQNRKSSHFWEFNYNSYICPICNLVYSCVPAGFNNISGKGIFINKNDSFKSLIDSNNIYFKKDSNIYTYYELESFTYKNILNAFDNIEMSNKERELNNIQVVKYNKDNSLRPYTFNVLSKEIINVLKKEKKRLEYIIDKNIKVSKKRDINLYEVTIKNLYNNSLLFDLINQVMNIQFRNDGVIKNFLKNLIHINNTFLNIKGGNGVNDKLISLAKFKGEEFKEYYKIKNSENKINGITYKLLNALKTKNKNLFLDTIINSYMYLGKEIPNVILECNKSVESLQTIGYSFILGIQSVSQKEKNNKGDNNNG